MKIKIISGIAVLALVGGVAFLYITRPLAQPTVEIESATEHLSDILANQKGDLALFRIVPKNSYVEFHINEVLRGSDFIAVGKTDQVTGELAVNFNDISKSQIGTVSVNARTFKTDDSRRDGVIGRAILRSEDSANEFIKFIPTSLKIDAGPVMLNKEFDSEISGDLVIAGIVRPVSFSGKVSFLSESILNGYMQALVKRSDFNLIIPQVPFVASVGDIVTLKINFSAERFN